MLSNNSGISLIHKVICYFLLCPLGFLSCSFESKQPSPSDERIASEEQVDVPAESEVRYLFIRGELALKKDDFKQALLFLEEARQKTRKPSPTIEKRLAQLYIRDGKLEEALKAAERIETAGGNKNESLNTLNKRYEPNLELWKGILIT